MRRVHDPIPAPKMFLPGHEESYNPPPEYLFTDKEKEQWERATREGDKRKLPFIPQKYASLRKVPAWSNFIRERFERCLDLYLAPRQRKMRLTIQPEDLVPQLPRPKDLQPFPTVCSVTFRGHVNMVRTVSVESRGQVSRLLVTTDPSHSAELEVEQEQKTVLRRSLSTIASRDDCSQFGFYPGVGLKVLGVLERVVGHRVLFISMHCSDGMMCSTSPAARMTAR